MRIRVIGFLLMGAAIVSLPLQNVHAYAIAVSELITLDFNFVLAGQGQESIQIGSPAVFGLPIGTGDLGDSDVQKNFGLGERFEPLDPTEDFNIHMFVGPVVASAPPPEFSLYIHQLTAFFTFSNYTANATYIDVFWNATYLLSAFGNVSRSTIEVKIQETDLFSGDELFTPDMVLISDQQTNDGSKAPSLDGNFVVSIDAGITDENGVVTAPRQTLLRINALLRAEAAETFLPPPPEIPIPDRPVPEPSTVLLLSTGFAGLLGLRWLCIKRRTGQS